MFTVSVEQLFNSSCSPISPWVNFLWPKANLFNAYRIYRRAFMLPGNHQGNKGSSVHTTKLISGSQNVLPRQLPKTDVRLKWNSNETGVFMPLIQRTALSQFSSERTKKGQMSLYLKTPKRLHTVYTQTNLLEKLKGWHSQCWMSWWPLLWAEMHVWRAY